MKSKEEILEKLITLVQRRSLTSKEVIEVSQKLDKILVEEMKEINFSGNRSS